MHSFTPIISAYQDLVIVAGYELEESFMIIKTLDEEGNVV